MAPLTLDVMSSSGMETASRASARVTHLRPSLFPGGVGKTWKEGDFEKLLGDVTSRVFNVYGDSTVVYPGHGTTPRSAQNGRTSPSGNSAAGSSRLRPVVSRPRVIV